jgi:hypothetical protein
MFGTSAPNCTTPTSARFHIGNIQQSERFLKKIIVLAGRLSSTARTVPREGPRLGTGLCLAALKVEHMAEPTHMDVVRRAYQLWQQAGQPVGKDQEFYLQAEQELSKSSTLRTPDILTNRNLPAN